MILEQRVCQTCMLRFRRSPANCPGCDELKVLAFYDDQHRPSCAACTANTAIYGCPQCGREDNPFGVRCAPCTLHDRVTDLLTDPAGGIHPQLQPVFDTLLAGPRPQTTLYWLTRTSSRPDILRRMARGELAISHASFDQLPHDRAVDYIHNLLAALGVLSPYHPGLDRIPPWLAGVIAPLPKDHADLLDRFARWHLLRRLRRLDDRGSITRSSTQKARAPILTTVRFLGWLAAHDTTITATTQSDLDRYLARHPGRGPVLAPFLGWTDRTGLTPALRIPIPPRALPQVTLSDEQRWQHVELLLHDDTIRLYSRIAGLFMLLFAQPLSRICRMKASRIVSTTDSTVVTVNFDTVPIELPEPLDELLRAQLARRGQASYASHPDNWLFPGGLPGRHLATENIRAQLVERGIQPADARKAAMFSLAAEIPTPVLAELLGLSPSTATRWATLAARDWSQYAALRRDAQPEDQSTRR
jgi:hypothetical protein